MNDAMYSCARHAFGLLRAKYGPEGKSTPTPKTVNDLLYQPLTRYHTDTFRFELVYESFRDLDGIGFTVLADV